MKKTKTILELLKLLLDWVKNQEDFSGMCVTVCDMRNVISYKEDCLIRDYLNKNKTLYSRRRPNGYWWKEGVRSYRIKWLNKHINLLKS